MEITFILMAFGLGFAAASVKLRTRGWLYRAPWSSRFRLRCSARTAGEKSTSSPSKRRTSSRLAMPAPSMRAALCSIRSLANAPSMLRIAV